MQGRRRSWANSAHHALTHDPLQGKAPEGLISRFVPRERIVEAVKAIEAAPPTNTHYAQSDKAAAYLDSIASTVHSQQSSLSAAVHARRMRRRLLAALFAPAPVNPHRNNSYRDDTDAKKRRHTGFIERSQDTRDTESAAGAALLHVILTELLEDGLDKVELKAVCMMRLKNAGFLHVTDAQLDNALTISLGSLADKGVITIPNIVEPYYVVKDKWRAREVVERIRNVLRKHDTIYTPLQSFAVRDLLTPSNEASSIPRLLSSFLAGLPIGKDAVDGPFRARVEGLQGFIPANLRTQTYKASITDGGALCTPTTAILSLWKRAVRTEDGTTRTSSESVGGPRQTPSAETQVDPLTSQGLASNPVIEVVSSVPSASTPLNGHPVVSTSADVKPLLDTSSRPTPPPASSIVPAPHPVPAVMPAVAVAQKSPHPATAQPTAPAPLPPATQPPPPSLLKTGAAVPARKRGRAATVSFETDAANGTKQKPGMRTAGAHERVKRLRMTYDGGWSSVNIPSDMLYPQPPAKCRGLVVHDSFGLTPVGLDPSAANPNVADVNARLHGRFGTMTEPVTRRRGGDTGPLDDGSTRLSSASLSMIGNGLAFVGAFLCRESIYTAPTSAIDAPIPVSTAPLQWNSDIAPQFQVIQGDGSEPSNVESPQTQQADTKSVESPPSPDYVSADRRGETRSKSPQLIRSLDDSSPSAEPSLAAAVPINVTVTTTAGSAATLPGLLTLQPYNPYTAQNPIAAGTRITLQRTDSRNNLTERPSVVTEPTPLSSPSSPTSKLDVFTPVYRELSDDEVYGHARDGLFQPAELAVLPAQQPWGAVDVTTGQWQRPTSVWDVFHAVKAAKAANSGLDTIMARVAPITSDIVVDDGIQDEDEALLDNAGYEKLHTKSDAIVRDMVAESMKRIQAARAKLSPQSPAASDKGKARSRKKSASPSSPSSSSGGHIPPSPGTVSPTWEGGSSTPTSESAPEPNVVHTRPIAQAGEGASIFLDSGGSVDLCRTNTPLTQVVSESSDTMSAFQRPHTPAASNKSDPQTSPVRTPPPEESQRMRTRNSRYSDKSSP